LQPGGAEQLAEEHLAGLLERCRGLYDTLPPSRERQLSLASSAPLPRLGKPLVAMAAGLALCAMAFFLWQGLAPSWPPDPSGLLAGVKRARLVNLEAHTGYILLYDLREDPDPGGTMNRLEMALAGLHAAMPPGADGTMQVQVLAASQVPWLSGRSASAGETGRPAMPLVVEISFIGNPQTWAVLEQAAHGPGLPRPEQTRGVWFGDSQTLAAGETTRQRCSVPGLEPVIFTFPLGTGAPEMRRGIAQWLRDTVPAADFRVAVRVDRAGRLKDVQLAPQPPPGRGR
jgi:hypothetical protein